MQNVTNETRWVLPETKAIMSPPPHMSLDVNNCFFLQEDGIIN